MGFLELLKKNDINAGVALFQQTENAILLDVRTTLEYASGRIPGSIHLPLDRLGEIEQIVPDKDTPLFVYCLSGARSGTAADLLRAMGYSNAQNIGGIHRYEGQIEEGT